MQIPDLHTARLRLVAITPAVLDIQESFPKDLGAFLDAAIPPSWPNSDWEPHVYSFMRAQFRNYPHTIGWHRYVLLREGDSLTLIGSLGSHPLGADEAEIGYGILDPWQNKGCATEAARTLLGHLFHSGLRRIRAQTYPHLAASLRVMQKCGMHPAGLGEEAGAVCYSIEREQFVRLSSP
ncbi:acetyltransferase, GNAT family [Acidisarcina polymorpha]|uniref:Acetyltransferase, GNAT family n=1 Tax=Acidisarcina polymorpha TaxID=2211140 RepID=A0A2Z5G671_9BACT|nr:GNAT family protein [Acidisarcina polymorpha]AXC14480.1 acetyltransferase, GNAT family [Acidisarcina polymorpha]